MKDYYIGIGVGERGNTLVVAPVNPQGRRAYPAEIALARLARMGMTETCDMLGTMMLSLLPMYHPGSFAGRVLVDDTRAWHPLPGEEPDPATHLGVTAGATLAVGVTDDGRAIAIEVRGAAPAASALVAIGVLDTRGPQRAVREVGELLLGMLATLRPAAFAWLT